MAEAQRAARSHHHAGARGIQFEDKQRLVIAGKAKALALADGEMNDAVMAAQHRARLVHDLARPRGIGPQLFDDVAVAAFRNETDVLAVGLFGIDQTEFGGEARTSVFSIPPKGKAQIVELGLGGGKEKIALVAAGSAAA